jgi:mannosyltransferase OCH1-like enzyme
VTSDLNAAIMMKFFILIVQLLLILISNASLSTKAEPWNYPILPSDTNSILTNNNTHSNGALFSEKMEKLIPRKIWVGVREKPQNDSSLPPHLKEMFSRAKNDSWEVNILENREQLEFMEKYWSNTSVLWAYKIINPLLGVAACDIWRYATLYKFGGLYLDDDSYIKESLEIIVKENDSLILTAEKNAYRDSCYIKSYKLSHHSLSEKYGNCSSKWNRMYGNKVLATWGMFAAPKHPAIFEVLKNVVETIRYEYLRSPVTYMMNMELRWKIIMCTTGPTLVSGTIRLLTAESFCGSNPLSIRVISNDYKEFGGIFKVDTNLNGKYSVNSEHYMVRMQKQHTPLLRSYVDFSISHFEGKVVSPGGKKIYLVENGSVHIFPNFDTFSAKKFIMSDILLIQNWTEFINMPEGPGLPAMPFRI